MTKISVLLIATKRYKQFVQPLIDSLSLRFLLPLELNIHLFTDEARTYPTIHMVNVHQTIIPSYGFPEATLYRYRIFTSLPSQTYGDYIYYMDVDMDVVEHIGEEILKDIVAVRHPGYYIDGKWGDEKTPKESTSYLPPEKRKHYHCGGFQGGSRYYEAMVEMAKMIRKDEERGIIPFWHDESAWNYYTHTTNIPITEFSPEYCTPEALWKRELWGIKDIKPRIIALEKDENIRNE